MVVVTALLLQTETNWPGNCSGFQRQLGKGNRANAIAEVPADCHINHRRQPLAAAVRPQPGYG